MQKNNYFLLLFLMSGSLLNVQLSNCKEPFHIYRKIVPTGVKIAMSFMTVSGAICIGKGLWDWHQTHKNGHEKTLMVELVKKEEEAKALMILGALGLGVNMIWLPKIIRNFVKRDKPLITLEGSGVIIEGNYVPWQNIEGIDESIETNRQGHVISRTIQLRDGYGFLVAEIDGELLSMSKGELKDLLNKYRNQ